MCKYYLYMKTIIAIITLAITTTTSYAQLKPIARNNTVKSAPKPTFKQNTLITSIGNQTGLLTLNAAQAKQLIDSALTVKDATGKSYFISRATFSYKRKLVYVDEDTQKKNISWEYLSKELRNGEQLDAFWRSSIKEDLKKGEELLFEKILVDTKKGVMLPAKSIIITIL